MTAAISPHAGPALSLLRFDQRRRPPAFRVPPNLFGIAFGLAGLGGVWHVAQTTLATPDAVPDALNVLAAAVWLAVGLGYLQQGWSRIWADLRDPILAPFVSLASITPLLLAGALGRENLDAGRALVVVFVATTVALGGWMTGQWIVGELDQSAMHPGYFLPTVAGGLIGAGSASAVGLHSLGLALFGSGMVCWLLLGSGVLTRLFFIPRLPPPLVPSMAIELAPPSVAGLAYFALSRGALNSFSYGLAGFAVLMALVQLRLIPIYARLKFSAGFWAFTFAYAAAASDALEWIARKKPAGSTGLSITIVALISIFIALIAARTVMLASRGQLLARSAPADATPPTAGSSTSTTSGDAQPIPV